MMAVRQSSETGCFVQDDGSAKHWVFKLGAGKFRPGAFEVVSHLWGTIWPVNRGIDLIMQFLISAIFDGTIRDNMRDGYPGASEVEISRRTRRFIALVSGLYSSV